MGDIKKKQVPIRDGLFTLPPKAPQLLGGRCKACGVVTFPMFTSCRNPDCDSDEGMEEIVLGNRGKLDTFTVMVYQPPPPWKGPQSLLPLGQAFIEMPGGLRIASVLTTADPQKLKVGMEMELVIENLYTDEEGNEVMTYKFRPVEK